MIIAHYAHPDSKVDFEDALTTIVLEPDGWYVVKEIHVYDISTKVCFYGMEGYNGTQFDSTFFDFYEIGNDAKKIEIDDVVCD